MNVLVLNPGGNSLKAEIVDCEGGQRFAFAGKKRISVSVEDIGKEPHLSKYEGKEALDPEPIEAASYAQAAENLLRWLDEHGVKEGYALNEIDCIGIRVVHGGLELSKPTQMSTEVEQKIVELEKLAPLHNKSSIEILDPVRRKFGRTPIYAVFDTAFHRTIPDHAALYAIPLELAEKHHIRRYGFHGISHRYLLERYAWLAKKKPEECSVVSMHLESGCSVTAISKGKSIDNTMGMTPLEGLMMGTRSGDVDPSLVEFLVREEKMKLDGVMTLLNKKSGLLGVSGESLDTRVLMKSYASNPRVKLAMEIFSYRLRKAIGAHLAALGGADAVIFGGGIAENTSLVRERVGEGLRAFGLEIDAELNEKVINVEGRISTEDSAIEAWVIPVEEGLQIAHECCEAMAA